MTRERPSSRHRARGTPTSRLVRVAVTVAVMASVVGCATPAEQQDPTVSPVVPSPVGARVVTEDMPAPGQDTSCEDPTASRRPTGALPAPGQMPAGSTMAAIVGREHLIAGVDQNTFLFGYRDPDSGDLSGFDVDIAREIARAIFGDPAKIQFRILNSAQRIPALTDEDGRVDVVVRTFTINCERRQEIEFSSVYFQSSQRVLVHKDSTVTGIGDLGGKPVCAAKDSTSIRRIANARPRPIPIEVTNWTDCLVMFQQGQAEAISTDDTILAGMKAQDPYTKIVGTSLGEEPYGIGIPKAHADMVEFVNAVLERLRADGTWTEIYRRHLGPLGEPPAPPVARYQN